jgi:pyridine nucleotide-disulfide oxidoreductase family protein
VKRLILAGSGHAHLVVLRTLSLAPLRDAEVCLATPEGRQAYSGMVPGWLAGHYVRDELEIDVEALSRRANVVLIRDRVEAMDADRRCVALSDGRQLEFDLLSLDTGSEIDTSWLEALDERLLPLRPMSAFMDRWPKVLAAARARPGYRLVIAGAGAAAVELALAVRHALDRERRDAEICLVAPREKLLAGHPDGARRRAEEWLHGAGIVLHDAQAVGLRNGLLLADGTEFPADTVIAATGAAPPSWLRLSRLRLSEQGYAAVDATHRSLSHGNVFAAGDVCARQDRGFARSGVHAVHAGPVLAHNLSVALRGGRLREYHPRARSLYLLAGGPRKAIVSWGRLSAGGAWAWRWKDRIDRRFVERHSVSPRSARLSQVRA